MTTAMHKALAQLNAVTGRAYTISSDGDRYTLEIPGGGCYPPAEQTAMMRRLLTLACAAQGRAAIKYTNPSGK